MEEENFALLISLLAPKAPGPLWSLNLGEIPFSVPQMIRIREALAMPNSTITHLFMEPLPHAYPLQAPNSEAGREAQAEVETEKGNPWKNVLRALLRINRKKHTRFLLSPDELQNRIIKQVCNMWYNPLNHEENRAWAAADRLSRDSSAHAIPEADDEPKAEGGAAVRVFSKGYGWEMGKIMHILPDGGAKIMWESGAISTLIMRKIAGALQEAGKYKKNESTGRPKKPGGEPNIRGREPDPRTPKGRGTAAGTGSAQNKKLRPAGRSSRARTREGARSTWTVTNPSRTGTGGAMVETIRPTRGPRTILGCGVQPRQTPTTGGCV